MGIEQEILELLVKVWGSDEAKRLQDVLEKSEAASGRAQAELDELSEAYGRGVLAGQDYAASKNRIESEMAEEARVRDTLTDGLREEAAAQDTVNRAAETAGSKFKGAQQDTIDLCISVQYVAQVGFPAILNNLESLGRGIPALLKNPMALLTNLPTDLTVAGTAIYLFGGKVYDAFKGFAFGANEIPKATDALGRIEGRLKDVTKQLDDYQTLQTLKNK